MLHPNVITGLRLFSPPVIILFLIYKHPIGAFVSFFIACCSDYIDGVYARFTKQTSPYGGFLDALTDKIFIISILCILLHYQYITGWNIAPTFVIIWREIFITTIRHLPGKIQGSPFLNKSKTAAQMLACGGFLGAFAFPSWLHIAPALLWISSFLALLSTRHYTAKLKFFKS